MNGCFVRLLFGDRLIDGYETLLGDLTRRGNDKLRPEPCEWYVCGMRNAAAVHSCIGRSPHVIAEVAVPTSGSDCPPDYKTHYGAMRYGRNLYVLKFEAILRAMRMGYDDVVFLDLDVRQINPLPVDFWDVLRAGQPIRAPLVQYYRKQCPWRQTCPRTSHYSATSYYRSETTMQRLMELSNERPLEFEQAAFNRLVDELAGGTFPGHSGYIEQGFDFPFTRNYHGMMTQPICPVFQLERKPFSSWKSRGLTVWAAHVDDVLASGNLEG